MFIGTGELVVMGVLALMVGWFVAPIVGIIRASNRKARGTYSAAAPILAGSSLGLLVCVWVLASLAEKPPSRSYFSYVQMGLHVLWLVLAIQANRAARRTTA
jgi:hypothetical protein